MIKYVYRTYIDKSSNFTSTVLPTEYIFLLEMKQGLIICPPTQLERTLQLYL
jgi:hypothetical protein